MSIPNVWTEPFGSQLQKHCMHEAATRLRMFALNPETWQEDREEIWNRIAEAMGLHYDPELPLEYKEYGKPIKMDGYTIKRVSYLGAPGRYVSGNLYIPDGKGPFPAVISVHGHWVQGRLAERVQTRGHALAKLGFVVLAVDAFGSGERSQVYGKYCYHGGLRAVSLMNVGYPLMGILVTDNMRGVDLLQSLKYVDGDRIGATGASGGGNQTMWLAAMDKRIKAAVPVVSVGTFESYMRTENCVCELLPGGLEICEESGVLALVAPRAIKMLNAQLDPYESFQPKEMIRSVTEAKKIFDMYGVPGNISSQIFNTPHGFSPAAREAMLGFMLRHLKGEGCGDPVPEPEYECLPEEDLMLFKGGTRPEGFGTLPDFTNERAAEYAAALMEEKTISRSAKVFDLMQRLRNTGRIGMECGGTGTENGWEKLMIQDLENDLIIPVLFRAPAPAKGKKKASKQLLVLATGDIAGKTKLEKTDILTEALERGDAVALLDLSDTGEVAYPLYFGLPQHHLQVRATSWLGGTLMGHWTGEYQIVADALLDRLDGEYQVTYGGVGDAGMAATFAAVLDERANSSAITENACCTFNLYEKGGVEGESNILTLAMLVPGILEWGDLTLAAAMVRGDFTMIAPRNPDGSELTEDEAEFFAECVATLRDKLVD